MLANNLPEQYICVLDVSPALSLHSHLNPDPALAHRTPHTRDIRCCCCCCCVKCRFTLIYIFISFHWNFLSATIRISHFSTELLCAKWASIETQSSTSYSYFLFHVFYIRKCENVLLVKERTVFTYINIRAAESIWNVMSWQFECSFSFIPSKKKQIFFAVFFFSDSSHCFFCLVESGAAGESGFVSKCIYIEVVIVMFELIANAAVNLTFDWERVEVGERQEESVLSCLPFSDLLPWWLQIGNVLCSGFPLIMASIWFGWLHLLRSYWLNSIDNIKYMGFVKPWRKTHKKPSFHSQLLIATFNKYFSRFVTMSEWGAGNTVANCSSNGSLRSQQNILSEK